MRFFCTLASGSSGNAALYCDGSSRILIDAGTNCKHIRAALGELGLTLGDISHILITHTHSDHVSALPVLLRHSGAQLICSMGAYGGLRSLPGGERAVAFEEGEEMDLNGVRVRAFATPHDSPGSVGYILGEGKAAVGYCTDLGCVTPEIMDALRGAPTVTLESNHDVGLLRSGPYPQFLKARILSDQGHLSNESCARAVETLVQQGTRNLVLAHLSERNNTPRHAAAETDLALYRIGVRNEVSVTVAPRRALMQPVML